MSAFSEDELAYMRGERRLARLGTVGADGTPDDSDDAATEEARQWSR